MLRQQEREAGIQKMAREKAWEGGEDAGSKVRAEKVYHHEVN
jgi:hypothetical protein